jgi:hypothetical protein
MRLSARSCVVALVAACALTLAGGTPGAGAQESTPEAAMTAARPPIAPDPAKCTAVPRELAEIQAIYDDVNAAGMAATPAAFVEPEGEPADAATVAAVTEVVVEVIRCNANGGNGLADASFLTDEHLRDNLTGLSEEEFAAIYPETPSPLPPEEWLMVYKVDTVRVLPDGRVAANPEIIVPGIGHFRDTLLFEEIDGRWLIDESHEGEPVYLAPQPETARSRGAAMLRVCSA